MPIRAKLKGQRKDQLAALEAFRRIELGGLPLIIEDKGRVWEIWDLDFEG